MRPYLATILSLLLVQFCIVYRPFVGPPKDRFLAVFHSIDKYQGDWHYNTPDYEETQTEWKAFPNFLKQVKAEAGNRPIIINLDCHGDQDLILINPWHITCIDCTTAEWVVREVEKELSGSKIDCLILEACYGYHVYSNTMKGKVQPAFPVYGIQEMTVTWNNLIYQQYKANFRPFFMDLREQREEKERYPDGSERQRLAMWTWITLWSFNI